MKNLFGIRKNVPVLEIDKYSVRKLSNEKLREYDEISESGEKVVKKSTSVNAVLQSLSYFCIAFGVLMVSWFLRASGFRLKDKFEAAMKDRGYLFIIGIALVVIGIFGYVFFFLKNRRLKNSPELKKMSDDLTKVEKECLSELGVPDSAVKIDIIQKFVKIDDGGNEKPDVSAPIRYINLEMYMFEDGDGICISDVYSVWALPRTMFEKIVKVNKKIHFPMWNKEESTNSEKYKKYRIYKYGNGLFGSKPHYSVRLRDGNDEYEMIIPNYELETFLKIINLKVEDN